MPNTGDFDPAEAIRQQRVAEEDRRQREEAEKQRAQAQQDLYRANILKLLCYADEQLEEIRNPVVSEFVVTERWWMPERIPGKGAPEAFRKTLRANQRIIGTEDVSSFFRSRFVFTVATEHERQTRYYGSWLWLETDFEASSYHDPGGTSRKHGLVKLRQPRAGYARVFINDDWDPRNVSNITIELTDSHGQEKNEFLNFQMYASLEEVAFDFLNFNLEHHTKMVRQALDFVATGQPPNPRS